MFFYLEICSFLYFRFQYLPFVGQRKQVLTIAHLVITYAMDELYMPRGCPSSGTITIVARFKLSAEALIYALCSLYSFHLSVAAIIMLSHLPKHWLLLSHVRRTIGCRT